MTKANNQMIKFLLLYGSVGVYERYTKIPTLTNILSFAEDHGADIDEIEIVEIKRVGTVPTVIKWSEE